MAPETQRLLCIDYGRKFTGLAVADFPGITARSLETLKTDRLDAIAAITKIIAAENVTRILLGFPFSDTEGAIHDEIRAFREKLAQAVGAIPIEFTDESYSSLEADALLKETGLGRRRKTRAQDSEAAKLVLLRYLRQEIHS